MNIYHFLDIAVGQKESFQVEITEKMENDFRILTQDCNPLHQDDDFAVEIGEGRFVSHVTFGMLTASFYSTLAGVYLPGKYSLIHSLDIQFQKPVYCGDRLTITGEVTDKVTDLKLLLVKAEIRNQKQKCVSKANLKILCLK